MPSRLRKSATKTLSDHRLPPFDPKVATAFSSYPKQVRMKLLALRRLILQTARATEGVGALEETLRGQVSYLTRDSKSGSTIRIDQVKSEAGRYALYFHCQTSLVETFRQPYGARLRRQSMHPPGRIGGNTQRCATPLCGAGADLSCEQTKSRLT